MKERNDQLVSSLEELIQLTRDQNETYWSSYLEDAAERCRRFNPYGLVRIQNAFGGMGSLNDRNYPDIKTNELFDKLIHQIYDLSKELLAETEAT